MRDTDVRDRIVLTTREEIKSLLEEGQLANPKPVLIRGVMGGGVKAGGDSFDGQAGTGIFTVTTPTEDSYGDVMVPEGALMERFQRNPVIPWAHDYAQLPVAKSVREEITPGVSIESEALFAREENPFAAQVFRMYQAGFLNAASIGFLPKDWVRNEKKDEDGNTVDSWLGGYVHKIWEFLEWSVLPVPANADALANGVAGFMRVARSAGMIDDGTPPASHPFLVEVVKAMDTMEDFPELLLEEAIQDQVRDEVKKQIEKLGPGARPGGGNQDPDGDLDEDLLLSEAMEEIEKLQATVTTRGE